MVKLMWHIAMALLWAIPAWFVWDSRVSAAFILFVLSTAMLPDVDLVLQGVIPGVEHHGVTHTVVFVVGLSVIGGTISAMVFASTLRTWWLRSEDHPVSGETVSLFVIGGLLLGGFSHLFADMLSAPDVAPPIKPLWPLVSEPISLDVIYYSSVWWNLGLMIVATVTHLLWRLSTSFRSETPLAGEKVTTAGRRARSTTSVAGRSRTSALGRPTRRRATRPPGRRRATRRRPRPGGGAPLRG